MEELVGLTAGQIDPGHTESDYSKGMSCIAESLRDNSSRLGQLWNSQQNEDFIRFGPLLGRLILEQSLAIIVGRFDAIRFLALVRGAQSADFVMGQQNPSSFNWIRDVHPDIPPPASWWTQKAIDKLLSRSLLHGHLADYLFSISHTDVIAELSDFTSNLSSLPSWVSDILNIEQGVNVLGQLRTRSKACYSILSKGIHFEFLEGMNTQMSAASVAEAIRDAMITVATAGLYSHFSDISLQRIERKVALAHFIEIMKKFDQPNLQVA